MSSLVTSQDFDMLSVNELLSKNETESDTITKPHDIDFASTLEAFDDFDLLVDDNFSSIFSYTTETSKQTEASKTSPWHESDSGMSETISQLGSPEPVNLIEPVQKHFLSDSLFENDIDIFPELSQSEWSEFNISTQVTTACEQNPGKIAETTVNRQKPVRKCRKTSSENADPLSDSDVSQSDVIEQPLNYFKDSSNFNVKPKADVKILKVVKQGSGEEPSNDDILKALDERSKKNAQQAKLNREKKKAYMKNLEDEVEQLKNENSDLKFNNEELEDNMNSLKREVQYLKSILANASALSGLLKNIENVQEVKLSSSILSSRKRSSGSDHTYVSSSSSQKRAKYVQENLKKAGVCLHVSDGSASLEFCSHCSELANKSS